MRIQLSEHFDYSKLIRFVLPSVIMMVFTSIYTVVDGLFVSNFVGKTPFAAINLIMPFLMGIAAMGFMFGTGGSALVAITLGEGRRERANQYFSLIIYAAIVTGVVLGAVGFFAVGPIASAMGATGAMLDDCILYGRILLVFQPIYMLQIAFQSFFVTAEKPRLGLWFTVGAGMTNIVLDALFVAVFRWGLAGAAFATVMSQVVGGGLPLIYFARNNDSLLRLTRTPFTPRALLRACANGSSELMTNLSSSVVNTLYNLQLMELAGEDGVAAYGVLMYINFIFNAIFFGYAIGSAPVISYHYGAGNSGELRSLFRKSLTITALCALVLTALAEVLSHPLSVLFVGYDPALAEMTYHGFRIYALAFLFCGFNIFGSAFFTALGNGGVSAAISFLRTLVFQVAAILLLPFLLGLDGVWLAIVAAELCALAVTVTFFLLCRRRYQYA